jgi:SPP1 gp7 family putative phage head morphogenesis protein
LVIDLLTPSEEEALRLLQELIIAKTAETRKRVAQLLARHITVSYYLGAERAINQLKLPIQPTSIGVQGLDAVINELAPILEESFGFLAKDLTDVIEEGIRNNLSYWQIKEKLQEKLKTFGQRILFQRAGRYKEIVEVSPTGKLRLVKKRIKRNVSIKTENYANMLARTATKKAYALGHIEGYKHAGLHKWRYSAVADERTRPHHLALHGKVFVVGSEEEQLALKVMGEPNCRCRPIPFFDDPHLDTPAEVYEQEKKEWVKQALDELKNKESKKARYLKKLL